MRILMLLSRFPYPLEKGDKLRAFNQLKTLSTKHEVYLCCFHEGKVTPEMMEPLKPYCRGIKVIELKKKHIVFNLVRSFMSGLPFQVGYFYSWGAQAMVNAMLVKHKPDAIYCQLIRTAEYARRDNTPIKVLDYMDAFSKNVERRIRVAPFYLRPLLRIEHRRLLRYEREVAPDFQSLSVISAQDRDFLPLTNKTAVHIVPNGVDTTYFSPRASKPSYDLLFTGNLSYPPNVACAELLAREVMPILLRKRPGTSLLIAGASPAKRVLDLQGKGVAVKGWTDDIRDYYAAAAVFCAPMTIGSGMQNKILEAMSMQLPCVTSSLVNNAIGASDGKEVLLADTVETTVDKILQLLDDKELSARIAKAGQSFVRQRFAWSSVASVFLNLFRK